MSARLLAIDIASLSYVLSFLVVECCGALVCCVHYKTGWSSLMVASENGHIEVVDKLLQYGARVDLQNEVYMMTSAQSSRTQSLSV